jgi:hypothetical protein
MPRAAARAVRISIVVLGAAAVCWAFVADPSWAERHVLASYCPRNAPEWTIAHGFRWIAGALGLLAAWKLAPAAARAVERRSWRPPGPSLLAIALAVAASLGVGEAYMRRQHRRLTGGEPASARAAPTAPMTRPDPVLGWSYLPARTTWTDVGGRRVAYAIDADGDRTGSGAALPDRARPTVLFAGESIAFGYGLPYEETLPFLVGRDLGVQAVSLAVVGYGNDQAHLRVVEALPRFTRPLAVVTVFVPTQIKRNVDPWRPRLALGPGGALERVPPAGGPRLARLLGQLPYHGDDALRVTAAILRATAVAAEARGALPLFVVTNYGPACLPVESGEPWVVEELFVRQGLAFVRVDLGPEDLLPGLFEAHPSLAGTRKLAAAVERALTARLGGRLVGATGSP